MDDRDREGIQSAGRQRDAWKAMAPFWERVDPALIDREMAQAYVKERSKATWTLRTELGMLSVAMRWAVRKKLIPSAPEVWRPAPPPRKERHLTKAQFRKFLEAVRAPHARLYMVLALATCARPTALLELTWNRVDFDRGLITLNPESRSQTAKHRPTVPIADYLVQPLKDAFEARTSAYVIERGGKPVATLKKAFSAASERSGIRATPYTLRHSGAVWRAEAGVPMAELAQLMGHSTSAMTEAVYARFSPTYLRKAANAGAW